MAWVVMTASAAAILLVGVVATIVVLGDFAGSLGPIDATFWIALASGMLLTVSSLTLRSLRWIFLLRRAGTRIPIRDAYIGYFSGLSLLLTPFLIGEIAVRARGHRRRARVPVATTVVVNLWDRLLDLVALAVIAGAVGLLIEAPLPTLHVALLLGAAVTMVPGVRRLLLRAASRIAGGIARRTDAPAMTDITKLAATRSWLVAVAASVGAWLLPGLALWALAGAG